MMGPIRYVTLTVFRLGHIPRTSRWSSAAHKRHVLQYHESRSSSHTLMPHLDHELS
jgi:hypothetical protein